MARAVRFWLRLGKSCEGAGRPAGGNASMPREKEGMENTRLISSGEIEAAYPAVRRVTHHTPVFTCASLAERCGLPEAHLRLKMENLQRTGSFKIRGAYHRLSQLTAAE